MVGFFFNVHEGKSVDVFKHRHIWPTEGYQRVCGQLPILSHTQLIVVLHCKPLDARPDVTALAFSPLVCTAAHAVLLNVTFLKALFNQWWSVVDHASSLVAWAAPVPKLAALNDSCECRVLQGVVQWQFAPRPLNPGCQSEKGHVYR